VVCAITSNPKKRRHSIPIKQKDLASGKLPIRSRVRADKILSIHRELVLSAFARLSDKKFDEVVTEVKWLVSRTK